MEDPKPALLRKMRGSGKAFQMKSRGSSMAPLIRTDSVVTLVFDPVEKVKVGDIVLITGLTGLVLHRVVGIREEGGTLMFQEKGDHQPFSSWVEASQVFARAIKIETGGRTFYADTLRGRRMARVILWGARCEMALYALKQRVFGTESSKAGRAAVRAGTWLRSGVVKLLGGQRRG